MVIRFLKIDRAIYQADTKTKTYRFWRRNHDWRKLSNRENIKNKKWLNGYTRLLSGGKKKKFVFKK